MEKDASGHTPLAANQFRVSIDGGPEHTVTLVSHTNVIVGDRSFSMEIERTPQGSYSLLLDDVVYEIRRVQAVENSEDISLQLNINGRDHRAVVADHRTIVRNNLVRTVPNSTTRQEIKAPMPGKVLRIEVEEGESVQAGKGLLVLEAMKMENEIKSSVSCKIERVFVSPGKAVEKSEVLLSIKPV